MSLKKLTLPLLLTALLLAACDKPPTTDRSGHLLSMAAEEAANIPNTLDRFTRQLNIADTQLRTSRKTDADKTLLLARDTLASAKKDDFDDFHRIAGWTAISQLARTADDRDLATKSADLALASLNDVKPEADRPQYVLSLSAELAELNGKPAAIELLNSGAGWAANIPNAVTRRAALVTFTNALLSYDAYDNARTALRHDPDAAWRTDTFLALANDNEITLAPGIVYDHKRVAVLQDAQYAAGASRGGGGVGGGGGGRGGRPAVAASVMASESTPSTPQDPALNFSKDVRFQNVYQQQPR